MAQKVGSNNTDPLSYMKISICHSLCMVETDSNEIIYIIMTLKNSCPGYDNMKARIVKSSYSLFIEPLTHVLNLSLRQGVFPLELKIANVIPLYKSGDAMSLNNYRPVSILPFFSKILEKLVYNRLLSFINKHSILYKFQFGFRKGYNTNMALISLVDKIITATNEGDFVL